LSIQHPIQNLDLTKFLKSFVNTNPDFNNSLLHTISLNWSQVVLSLPSSSVFPSFETLKTKKKYFNFVKTLKVKRSEHFIEVETESRFAIFCNFFFSFFVPPFSAFFVKQKRHGVYIFFILFSYTTKVATKIKVKATFFRYHTIAIFCVTPSKTKCQEFFFSRQKNEKFSRQKKSKNFRAKK